MVAHAKDAKHAKDRQDSEQRQQGSRALLVVIGLAVAFAVVPRVTRSCESASLDEVAPEFDARIVANAERVAATADASSTASPRLTLSSLRGRTVVLDFWATWCGPCQAESPIVNALAERYRNRGLAVVGVNTSDEDGLARAFAQRKGLTFPIVYDEDNTIAKHYGVSSLPTLIVVSKGGKIVAVRNGVTSDAALDEIIQRYL
jgi:thiol-disulfide isomerase/thioredoxin